MAKGNEYIDRICDSCPRWFISTSKRNTYVELTDVTCESKWKNWLQKRNEKSWTDSLKLSRTILLDKRNKKEF